MSDLSEIPGISEDLTQQKENVARTFAFKAFRCFHLAESYVVMKKWAESMALFDRALEHVTQTLENYRELKLEADGAQKMDMVFDIHAHMHKRNGVFYCFFMLHIRILFRTSKSYKTQFVGESVKFMWRVFWVRGYNDSRIFARCYS